ncbi:Autotransporter-associated beta strand repeat protein [Posidoniimonas corsicana]|uniref:Autotransporter-associated beta strand repeat protein n=1 Tax=Posidoniimonas corsicana TaxID=1938618 RepID=A0A5C5VD01_9BACT|nr:autotransporter-associated beta strand repeat-containing protein [Posidoniimonas corsicana]TWT36478.1 Autotransporter-associated beta strand repeat protein [Posidoniimonas corsicana]
MNGGRNQLQRIGRLLALAATITIGTCVAQQADAQTTLYSDDFSGSGGLLNGVAPDVANGLSSAWLANSPFLDNGTTNGTLSGSALLDLTLQANAEYSLSVDIAAGAVSGDWGGVGFASGSAADFIGAPGADGGNDDRFTDGPGGQAWALIRDIDGGVNAGDVEFFGGPGTGGGTLSDGSLDIVAGTVYNLEILLTTASDGASYTADLLINGVSRTGGPVAIGNAISSIGSVGLTFNNTVNPGHTFDNFLLTETIIGAPANVWDVDGGGSFNASGNWSEGVVPTSSATFSSALTAANAPGVVTLDSAVTLQEVRFTNAAAGYTLAGPAALTLNGGAIVDVTGGEHTIAAVIQGSSGLTKTGAGSLLLAANNTYTGATAVNGGALRVATNGAVDGAVSVAAGASFGFSGDGEGGGFSGVFANPISGAGAVVLSNTLTTETITFNNAKSHGGQTQVNGGVLALGASGALGAADGTAASGTTLAGNASTSRIALSGGVNVGNEVLVAGAREGAGIEASHLSSAGSNSWAGAIKGEVGGTQYNFESTSGTLTLGGTISAPDTGVRNFVFGGAGNTTITGRITDFATDADGVPIDADLNGTPDTNAVNNVNVIKRGAGTLTISTGTDFNYDFHQGTTVVEEGALVVTQGGGDTGELWSSSIQVSAGARFNVTSFGDYSLQEGQELGGGGEVQATTLTVFGDNSLTPGDNGRGTLNITGNLGMSNFGADGQWNYELGDATTVGGSENDLIAVSGAITGASGVNATVSVTPVDGSLATGAYRLVTHNSGSAPSVGSLQTQVVDNVGNVLNPRQLLSVSSTASQVNLNVSGTRASLTWNGVGASDEWDVGSSSNWTGGATAFRDLDAVTFGAGGAKEVVVNSVVSPGSVTFNSAAAYEFTGTGGITGYGPVNVNAGTVTLGNSGNNYRGQTTVASGATLSVTADASVGSVVVNGTLALTNNTMVTLVDDFNTPGLSEYAFSKVLDQGTVTNVSFSDAAGTIDVTSTGADGAEQVLLLRNDVTLAQGEELHIDAPSTLINRDFGLAIGQNHADLGNGGSGDNRSAGDYLFIAWRTLAQLNGRGFNGNAEIPLEQEFEVNAERLFIARLANDDVELGWYEGGSRFVSYTATPATTDIFSNIGFYGDLRADGDGFAGADNLRIVTGAGADVIDVDGDFTLAGAGTLQVDLSETGFASLAVTGNAVLEGLVDVDLVGGFVPGDGQQFTILTAAEILSDLGDITFNLPTNFSASIQNLTDLVLTYSVGLDGDFNGDGVVDAADYTVWRDNLGQDAAALMGNGTGDPSGLVVQADYNLWRSNYGAANAAVGGAAAAPEPATAVMASMLLLGLGRRRRRPA